MVDTLLKLAAIQSVLLVILLMIKKKKNEANFILALLVFFFGFSCWLYSFNSIEFYLKFPHLIRLDWGIPLLYGPLIYVYTITIIYKRKWSKEYYIHFLPYLLNLLILTPFFLKSSEEKLQILDYFTASITNGIDYYSTYGFMLRIIISIVSLFYGFKGLNVIAEYRKKTLQEYSNLDKIRFNWLQKVLYSYIVLSLIFIITSIFTFGDPYPEFDYNIYYYLFLSIIIYILSYETLSRPEILKFYIPATKLIESKRIKPIEEMSKEVINLHDFMVKEKPYLNGELTASNLAKCLNLSRHQLSSILNEHIGKNFYDFINEYRADEFKRRLVLDENKNLTLLAIALDSGFNSKTTFNTIFKKYTGLTPSQYKLKLK